MDPGFFFILFCQIIHLLLMEIWEMCSYSVLEP